MKNQLKRLTVLVLALTLVFTTTTNTVFAAAASLSINSTVLTAPKAVTVAFPEIIAPVCNFVYSVDTVNKDRTHWNDVGKDLDLGANNTSPTVGNFLKCKDDIAYAGISGTVHRTTETCNGKINTVLWVYNSIKNISVAYRHVDFTDSITLPEGANVTAGAVIARISDKGCVTFKHIHFTVHSGNNNYANRLTYHSNWSSLPNQWEFGNEDATPPTTFISLLGISGGNGWYHSAVQVTLSALDNSGGSGVSQTQYQINSDTGTWLPYSAPFSVSMDGTHAIYYKSVDVSGNWEDQKSATFKINLAPSIFLGNFDSNTLLDLIYPYDYGNENTTTLVQFASQGGFDPWAAGSTSTGQWNFALDRCKPLLMGDVNGDGRDDLVCPYDYGNENMTTLVQLAPQSGPASWTVWSKSTGVGNFALDHCKPMLIGDVNGDGRDDLICPYDYGNENMTTLVQLAPQSGLASWSAWSTSTGQWNFALDHCKLLLIGDVNGDGRDDLVCPYDYGNADTTTLVQLAPQTGLLASWTAWSTRTGAGNFDLDHCKPMLIGDVNGDGRDDLVCPYDYGKADTTTSVQLAPQTGLLAGWTAWSTRTGVGNFDLNHCRRLLIGDITGDGRDDLVCPYDYLDGTTITSVQISENSSLTQWKAWSSRYSWETHPAPFMTHTPTATVTSTPTITKTPAITVQTFISIATQDGWLLETSETNGFGGTINATATTFNLGDDAAKKQYRGILSFNTSTLPDIAVITGVTLKVKKQGIVGDGNPLSIFQGFMVDIKKGLFGTTALQTTDFQTIASKTYGPFMTSLVSGWYGINLTSGKTYINKLATNSGLTQIRLHFKLDDNNDAVANYLSLYSGDAPAASRPQLAITYYVP